MTAEGGIEGAMDALRAGACGYLVKDMDPDRLGAALRGVLNGESALPRTLMTKVIDEFRGRQRRQLFARRHGREQLTTREWEVAELLRSGASTEAIASRLNVSTTTVRVHVSNIIRKLHVDTRDKAVRVLNEAE